MFVIVFLLALSILVIIHEFGHYFAARFFGVKAEEFGFGFPPRLIGFVKDRKRWKIVGPRDDTKYANTVWSLNWLPLGGFVRIKGEHEDGIHDFDSIHSKPIWQRIIIIAAGVFMNWIFAILLFATVFLFGTVAILEDLPAGAAISNRSVMVMDVLPGSPAARAGLHDGDGIVTIEGISPHSAREARDTIRARGLRETSIVFEREGEKHAVLATPELLSATKRIGIGVALEDVGTVSFPFADAVVNAVRTTILLTKTIVVAFALVLRDLFFGKVASDVSGPVGIAVMANRIAKQGMMPFLQFAALLSVNLAVINFLPIPALDGGRVLFLALEKLRRRPMSRHLEIGIHNIAFIILILIILLVTARDLTRYGGTIVGGVRGAIGL